MVTYNKNQLIKKFENNSFKLIRTQSFPSICDVEITTSQLNNIHYENSLTNSMNIFGELIEKQRLCWDILTGSKWINRISSILCNKSIKEKKHYKKQSNYGLYIHNDENGIYIENNNMNPHRYKNIYTI
jgi:hypothetical protein